MLSELELANRELELMREAEASSNARAAAMEIQLGALKIQVQELLDGANYLLGAMSNADNVAEAFELLQRIVNRHWDEYAERANAQIRNRENPQVAEFVRELSLDK